MIRRTGKNSNSSLNLILLILITIFFAELFIGGGGGVFSFYLGPIRVTLRMIMFIIILVLYFFTTLSINKGFIMFDTTGRFAFILLSYSFFSSMLGMLAGHTTTAVIGDLQPVLYLICYFPILTLFSKPYIRTDYILNLLYLSSAIVSVLSISIFLIVDMGFVGNYEMRSLLSPYLTDYGIRTNNGFFYGGQFYVLIADVILISKFLYGKTSLIEKGLIFLYSCTILQSSTRGAIIVLAFATTVLLFKKMFYRNRGIKLKQILWQIVCVSIIFPVVVMFISQIDLVRLFSYDDASSNVRTTFITESIDAVLTSPIIGIGYGSSLPTKGTDHLEISFLEILLEQGIIGLILWFIFIFSAVLAWKKIKITNPDKQYLAVAMPLVVISVVLISVTNPYINNSVGISCIYFAMLLLNLEKRQGLLKNE